MYRLAHLVARYPWAVLLLWLIATLLCIYPAALAPGKLSISPGAVQDSESQQVTRLLSTRFAARIDNPVLLLVTPKSAAASFAAGLGKVAGVQQVLNVSQLLPQAGSQAISQGAALLVAQIPLGEEQGRATSSTQSATQTLARVREYASSVPNAQVRVTGGQAIADDFMHFAEHDTKQSELTALPLTGLVLLIVFGALFAALLPLATSLLSITVAMAGLYVLAGHVEVSLFAQSVITMLGLGAGIDYALLMVNRFREELRLSGSTQAATQRAIQTAGRSIVLSGLTVAVAMSAMILPPISYVRSLGIGGVLVVLLTVLASVTALPALLCVLGKRVNGPRWTGPRWTGLENLLRRAGIQAGGQQLSKPSARWAAFARTVTGRPWPYLLGGAATLLLLALPATHMKTGYAGAWGLMPGVESRDALATVRDMGAGGLLSQFEVMLALPAPYTPTQAADLRRVTADLRTLPGVAGVVSPVLDVTQLSGGQASLNTLSNLYQRTLSTDHRLVRLTVIPQNYLRADQIDGFEGVVRSQMQATLRGLNATRPQAPLTFLLGGAPVGEREFSRAITSAFPLAVGVVFVGTFLLLMVAFRSVVIPLKSILMNTLTVGAGYGIVTLVIQDGWLSRVTGLPTGIGVLDSSLPIMLFAVMFGLSMDYEIFLLSRVQEEYLQHGSNQRAVVTAVGRTARLITSAAVIMLIVFAAFMHGRVIATKSMGLGLSAAVVLDATLVRLVLVPAFLKLAGRWNWWLPAWLQWLPQVRLEEE